MTSVLSTLHAAQSSIPPAVVVGLCAHGLALVRDLAGAGIPVIALESDGTLPGTSTRHGQISFAQDINKTGLIPALDDIASRLPPGTRPVLMLTNDRMVEVAGREAVHLSRSFRLSWADSATRILPLLEKGNIESRCMAVGLNYPRSRLLTHADALEQTAQPLSFPVIAKPTKPLSAFKTLVAHSMTDLLTARRLLADSMPVVIQEVIAGSDEQIHFGALYLRNGQVLARFEGRKLLSRPMGHTTIAVSEPNDQVHDLAVRFFDGLMLSGPVSLELKRGPDGRFWVIEPTVGRTDFWSGLCSANGVPLPVIEYYATLNRTCPTFMQRRGSVWINGERQPAALLWLARHHPEHLLHGIRGVYFNLSDPLPFFRASWHTIRALPMRLIRKIDRQLSST